MNSAILDKVDAPDHVGLVDLIHIGDYKTGTTWLQMHAFQQHPELVYVDWPRKYPEIARLFYELVDSRDLDFNPQSLRERFRNELERIDRKGKKLIVSRESLCGMFISGENGERIAERLYRVFGPVKILLVIREQFSMLGSIYSQYLKIGGTLSISDFVFDPLDARNLISRLRYDKLIQAYRDIFGEENVSVMLFEELQQNKASFLSKVLTHIGCHNTGFTPNEHGPSNPSLTKLGAVFQRMCNRLLRTHTNPSKSLVPIDKLVSIFLTSQQKNKLLRIAEVQLPEVDIRVSPQQYLLYAINLSLNLRISMLCEKVRIGGKIEIPKEIINKLQPVFKESNRTLVDRYGLELKKYGWPL